MTGRSTIKLLAAGVAVLAGGVIVAGGIRHALEPVDLTLEQVLSIPSSPLQLHLYPQSEHPAADGKEKKSTLDAKTSDGKLTESYIVYKDGATEDWHYYGDGKTKAASEDYFATTKAGRLLRAAARFEPDGETYKFHKVYRANGRLERIGHRERDGRYEQVYLFEDGLTPARIRWFDSSLAFLIESVYRWNADHTKTWLYAKVVRADFVGQHYVNLYREDGTLAATLKHTIGSDDTGRLYDKDGITLLAEYGREISGTRSYYLGYEKGFNDPVTEFNSLFGKMTVTVQDPLTRHILMRQVWEERPAAQVSGGKRYLLRAATQFDPASNGIVTVKMSGDGSRTTQMIQTVISSKDGGTVKGLGEPGSEVVGGDKQGGVGKTLSEPLLMEGQAEELPKLDAKLLEMPSRLDLPTFDDFGPPHLYDYW